MKNLILRGGGEVVVIKVLILELLVLLSVAIFTLWERKVLRYSQNRKGPNLVGIVGVIQPFRDGLKLLTKKLIYPNGRELLFRFLSPFLFFLRRLIVWIPLFHYNVYVNINFLFFLVVSSVSALLIFFSGWGVGRKFSFLGGVRASAQIISYEVVLSFSLLIPFLYFYSFRRMTLLGRDLVVRKFFSIQILPLILVIILAETNRTPFDLTEGERELVRGFNTEHSSSSFVLLFLGEYSFILFFRILTSLLFFCGGGYFLLIVFFFIWSRASFPRKRYDKLIILIWMFIFPLFCSLLYFHIFFLRVFF